MTKLKSKKMTKSTFAIIIMAIAMVAMLAFGGTYAYFTATTTADTENATTGRVQLGANSIATLTQKVVPGQELLAEDAKITVSNNSNVKTIIFVKFDATFKKAEGAGYNTATPAKSTDGTCDTEGEYKLNPTMAADWVALDGSATAGDTADDDASFAGIYYLVVNPTAADGTPEDKDVCTQIVFDGYSVSTETLKGSLMDGTITVTLDSSAIQFEGMAAGDTLTLAEARTAYGHATITEPAAG